MKWLGPKQIELLKLLKQERPRKMSVVQGIVYSALKKGEAKDRMTKLVSSLEDHNLIVKNYHGKRGSHNSYVTLDLDKEGIKVVETL